jgi:hypothetical protein
MNDECPDCGNATDAEVAWLHEQLEQAVAKAAGEYLRGLEAAFALTHPSRGREAIRALIEQEKSRG